MHRADPVAEGASQGGMVSYRGPGGEEFRYCFTRYLSFRLPGLSPVIRGTGPCDHRCPTKRQARIVKGYLSSFFNENDFLRPFLVRETSEEVELSNRIVICVLSSDYRSLRGYTAIACIVDELAYLSIEGSGGIRRLSGACAVG